MDVAVSRNVDFLSEKPVHVNRRPAKKQKIMIVVKRKSLQLDYTKTEWFFLTGPPYKRLSVILHSKSHQKSSSVKKKFKKCQNFLRVWRLVIFRADQ